MVSWEGDRQRRFDPTEAADLRRRRKAEIIERLLGRLAPLPDSDRILVEAIYRDGRSAVEVAALVDKPAPSVRRKVRRIVRRALSERFAFVVVQREHWSSERRRVADACVIAGKSLRDASRALHLTLHQVRRHWESIETLFETSRPTARQPGAAARGTPPARPAPRQPDLRGEGR